MKAWDTNVLIRHLTEDDPNQLAIARAELAKAERRNEGIWLSLVIMIETAWVLTAYDLTNAQILKALEAVTQDTRFQIEHGSLLSEAIQRSRKKGDLPEHVASLVAKKSVAAKTQTFDKAVKSFSEFEVL
jgi:predicted nucleic-acid-binding protein